VLASNGQHQRREWFGTACCPANIARLVTSVGNYIYGKSNDGIWVNLFVGSNTNIKLSNTDVAVTMETNYPWDGKVKINIDPTKKANFKLYIREPGWLSSESSEKDIYMDPVSRENRRMYSFILNGKEITGHNENGYEVIETDWKKGDVLKFEYPMEIRQMVAKPEVKVDNSRIALQRGPLVYCVEGADNKEGVWNLIVPANTGFKAIDYKILDEPVIALQTELPSAMANENGDGVKIEKRKITAIPYYCWANRGANDMQVLLPTKIKEIKINYSSKYEDGGNY